MEMPQHEKQHVDEKQHYQRQLSDDTT